MSFFENGDVVVAAAGEDQDCGSGGELLRWLVDGQRWLENFLVAFVGDEFFIRAVFGTGGQSFPDGDLVGSA